MLKYILATLLFFSASILQAQSVSRYRIDTSEDSITALHWNIGKGLYGHRQDLKDKIESVLSGRTQPIELSGDIEDFLKNTNLKIEIDELPGRVIDVLNRLKSYVLNTKKDGSVRYSYNLEYEGWKVYRSVYVENDHLVSKVEVYGNIYSRVDNPSVYTNINYARLIIDAYQSDKTNIKTTMTLGYNQSYCARCNLVRRISSRIAPVETRKSMSTEIDSKLYLLSEKVKVIIQEGRDHQTIVDEWLNLLKRMRIRIQR